MFLSKRSIDLLLRAMEARSASVQGATLHQVSPRATEILLEAKLLVAGGRVPVVAAMDDYEDVPFEATWSPVLKSYGYHDSVGRWIQVDEQEIAAYRVDYQRALAAMLMPFERQGPSAPQPLIKDQLWDVGTIKLAGAKAPLPVWFARRLGVPAVWKTVEALFERRPPEEVRIILTSTPGDRVPVTTHKRNHVINVADVLNAPGKLAISQQILGARVFPGEAQHRFPIDHSEDCGIVWCRGETLTFRGDKQRRFLEILFSAYWSKSQVLRLATVLEEAGYGGQVNTLKKAFGRGIDKWRFVKVENGNCWIDP